MDRDRDKYGQSKDTNGHGQGHKRTGKEIQTARDSDTAGEGRTRSGTHTDRDMDPDGQREGKGHRLTG
jgi:hypothetical protein